MYLRCSIVNILRPEKHDEVLPNLRGTCTHGKNYSSPFATLPYFATIMGIDLEMPRVTARSESSITVKAPGRIIEYFSLALLAPIHQTSCRLWLHWLVSWQTQNYMYLKSMYPHWPDRTAGNLSPGTGYTPNSTGNPSTTQTLEELITSQIVFIPLTFPQPAQLPYAVGLVLKIYIDLHAAQGLPGHHSCEIRIGSCGDSPVS